MPELRLEINDGVTATLRGLHHRLQNPSSLMAGIAAEMLSMTEAAFTNQGDGEKWAALKPSTIRQRTKRGTWPGRILDVSSGGGLAASIQMFSSSTEAGLSSDKPYAAIHQFGGTTGAGSWMPGKKIPARPFMPVRSNGGQVELTEKASASILSMMIDMVESGLG